MSIVAFLVYTVYVLNLFLFAFHIVYTCSCQDMQGNLIFDNVERKSQFQEKLEGADN